jgi:nucleoside-diphosphate-sugar epimerase
LIFATGKTGTIGRHLCDEITALAINLKDSSFVEKLPLFSENDSLIHLAGIVGAQNVDSNPNLGHEVNVRATIRLAKHFREFSKGQFVYISTSHVYRPGPINLKEYAETDPISLYASQKLASENSLFEIFENEPSRLCVLRVFSILDWDVKPFTLGGGIQKLADKNSEYVLRFSDDVRDFLTPRSTAKIIEQIAVQGSLSGIVNLCSGVGLTIGQAAEKMLGSAGFEIPSDRVESGNSNIPYLVGDNSKLLEALPHLDLGWKPSFTG